MTARGVCRLVLWHHDDMIILHRRYSMSRQKNSILINEHVLNREPVPLKFYFNILWSLDTFFNVDYEINFKAIKNLKMHWPWDDNNYLLQIFSLFTNTFRRKTSAKITRSWYAQTCMVEKITITAPESLSREVYF